MRKNSDKTKRSLTRLGSFALLFIISALMLLPLFFLLSTSLKSLAEVLADNPSLLPGKPHFENYRTAFTSFPFGRYLTNTLILTAARVTGTLLSCAVVAWGFARYPSRLNTFLFMVCLSTMMLPAQVTAIPIFTGWVKMGFYNTYVPLIAPAWLATNAFFIFLLKQFFEAIPNSVIEAARLDGASEWAIFRQFALPLSRPILWTVAVFTFIHSWNDYFGPLIYLIDDRLYPLSIGLTYFSQASRDAAFGSQWNLMMAVSAATMIPVAILFFFAQRSFVDNAFSGGAKL